MAKRILTDRDGAAYDLAQVSAVVRCDPKTLTTDGNPATIVCDGLWIVTGLPFEEVLTMWTDYVMTQEAHRRLPAATAVTDNSQRPPSPSSVDGATSSAAQFDSSKSG